MRTIATLRAFQLPTPGTLAGPMAMLAGMGTGTGTVMAMLAGLMATQAGTGMVMLAGMMGTLVGMGTGTIMAAMGTAPATRPGVRSLWR